MGAQKQGKRTNCVPQVQKPILEQGEKGFRRGRGEKYKMTTLSIKKIGIPPYDGLEISYEDIVYNYLRSAFSERGYAFKVKRSGCQEIDSIIRSQKGTHGKGSCDGYAFSGLGYKTFQGLVELESTGKIDDGITQIKGYARSFTAKTLGPDLAKIVSQIESREITLVVFDGARLWVAKYSLDTKKLKVDINKLLIGTNRLALTDKLFTYFPDKKAIPKKVDESILINLIADSIRGREKFQKNKALLMTILASIFGTTRCDDFDAAIKSLKKSQDAYEVKILETFQALKVELGNDCDELLGALYKGAAASLFELSQDKGMDLYGYIYEELATKDTKKEHGEYYTPRHTIRPILSSVMKHYLQWNKDEMYSKVVFDPFCGSGGFLYEYINLQKYLHALTQKEVDRLAAKTLFGADKNEILAAYLNLYLIGDGSANLKKVASSINWRSEPFYKAVKKGSTNRAIQITDKQELLSKLKSRSEDLIFLTGLYSPEKITPESSELAEIGHEGESNPIHGLIRNQSKARSYSENKLGNVDLLLTNVPYGTTSLPLEKFSEGSINPYGSTLASNALRECIDFLRPGKIKNGKISEQGGVGVVVVPDSILENPSDKRIRDYLIERCEILSIISLPPFTFSPYAMEKTYVLIFRKLPSEWFDAERPLDEDYVFIYSSISDGKANSVNRYPTTHMTESTIKLQGGKKKVVAEFLHNDFDPCFDSYFNNKPEYLSKLERAWDSTTWQLNPEWDQHRVAEQWDGAGWKQQHGRKWGYYPLVRESRTFNKVVKKKTLSNKIANHLSLLNLYADGESVIEVEALLENQTFMDGLTQKEEELINSLYQGEIICDLSTGDLSIVLYKQVTIIDVVLNPDSHHYLGVDKEMSNVEDILSELKALPVVNEDSVIEYFKRNFKSVNTSPFMLCGHFEIEQGSQFSKQDAYGFPGLTPVYTAATDGPAYYASEGVPGKVSVKGPCLIWSRKGAKAGTIQLFDGKECYITDVSGSIKPKSTLSDCDLTFLRYYLAGQVKSQIQAQSNNAQLNKSKLESLDVFIPSNHKDIGDLLRKNGL